MKNTRVLVLTLSACFVSAVWGQKVTRPPSVNWTEFHTKDMERWNQCEKVLNVHNVGNLSLKWSYITFGSVETSPAVAKGVVYVGSDGFRVYALNANTGAELWSFTTGNMVDSSPAVANGVVYVGSEDNNVYALNAKTGAKRWSYATGGYVTSSPAVANGVVYVGSYDNNVYAFDAKTGAKLWSYTTGSYAADPVVANGVVYVGDTFGSTVYAFGLP